MKLSGFIAGGLVGAAAALYVARKRPGAAAVASRMAGELWSKAAGRTMSGMIAKSVGSASRARSAPAARSSQRHAADSQSWDRIAALVSSDPAVKKETDKIMSEAMSAPAHH